LGFVAYLPAAVLTGHLDSVAAPQFLAVLAPLVGMVAFIAALRLWKFSLRHYKGRG
jgi:ABC-2 type transport system permease protein